VEGDPLLIEASVDALRESHFRPYLLNGTPLRVESQVGFHFSVSGDDKNVSGSVEYMSSVQFRPEFRTGVVTTTMVSACEVPSHRSPLPACEGQKELLAFVPSF